MAETVEMSTQPTQALRPEDFRQAMSRLGAAVNIITTDGAAGRHGFTASAVCSVTDRPPTLLVCMNRDNSSHDHFLANGVLCVNVLSEAHELLSGAFANHALEMDARFAQGRWQPGAHGVPRLAGAHASFDCRIAQVHEVGTHSVLFCEVTALAIGEENAQALIWLARGYHRLPAKQG